MSALLILGAGGHGKVVAEAAIAGGHWQDVSFLDGRYPQMKNLLGWKVVGLDSQAHAFLPEYPEAFIAVGDNHRRMEHLDALSRLGFRIPVVVHPSAWVSPSAILGPGTVVMAHAVINASAILGRGCIVNTGATVDHDCKLGDGVHVSPGAHIGGETVVGAHTWLGIGASMRHCIRVGADVVIGAGAAVVSDIPDGATATGVPATPRDG